MNKKEYLKDILIWLGLFTIWVTIGLAISPIYGYPNPLDFPKKSNYL